MSHFIGFDLGTSSVKLCLVDEEGTLLREANEPYDLSQPAPGWIEIAPQTWWDASCRALTNLLEGADISKIKGIGVTGQMHTLILLDQEGRELRPALMWNDTRTAELIPEMRSYIEDTEISYLDRILSTGCPAANMLWFKRNEPELFQKLGKFLIGPDYIVYRLTGEYGTDYCEASTSSMYDTRKRIWSPVMQKLLDLPDSVYPEVKGSAEIAGSLLPEIAQEFGLSSDVVVITGTGDNPAASIPTGCLGKKYPVFSMGTSGVLMFPRKKLDYDLKGKNILFGFFRDECNILVQGAVQSCGSSYSWWNRQILAADDYHVDDQFDQEKLGESSLLFYPHLLGDKTIYADPSLKGAFIGIGTDTDRNEMTLAVMEGVAFALRELSQAMLLEETGLTDLKVIGGGSKSRIWMQILADVMDLPIAQLGGEVGAGFGMALLAAYACGEIDSVEHISDNAVSVKEYFYPRPYNVGLYREKYKRYKLLHDAVKAVL